MSVKLLSTTELVKKRTNENINNASVAATKDNIIKNVKLSTDEFMGDQIETEQKLPTRNTFNKMLNQIGNSASMIQSTNPMSEIQKQHNKFFQGKNSITNLNNLAQNQSYPYYEYYQHIHGFSTLFDPKVARKFAHTFFVETLFMLCDNVTDQDTYRDVIVYLNSYNLQCKSPISIDQGQKQVNTFPQSITQKYDNFSVGLLADVTAQHEVNMKLQDIDYQTRESYLEDQLDVITRMTEHQKNLIDSLTHWSNYLDEQAQEYAHLHETISTKMTTFKRKDVFDIQESNSLEIWNKWSTIIFWVLVIIFVLMLVVQHYRSLSNMASQAEQQFKDTASKAYDAITQVQ